MSEFLVMFVVWLVILAILNWVFRAQLRRRMRRYLPPPCKSCDRDKAAKQYLYLARMWRQS